MKKLSLNKIVLQPIQINHFKIDVLRLDLIHPIVSGNKWFKLKYYLADFQTSSKKTLATFGGAYSNHIVATAFVCNVLNIKCVGFIRGEAPKTISSTLQNAADLGMQIQFLSRADYLAKDELMKKNNEYYWIPEGGYGRLGAKGAGEILEQINTVNYSKIICSVGTGTMIAGLINQKESAQEIIGINVLKGNHSIHSEIENLLLNKTSTYSINNQYHFGGYAKKNNELIHFMNLFYEKYKIPTDFVYSGKLMYAITDLCNINFFKTSDKILVIHCGGLQGNDSLPKNSLSF